MRLSVIVPTHNRVEGLTQTLAALARQTLPRDSFEILVIDDGSSAEQRQKLRGLRAPVNYRLIEKPQGGLASARNLGAENAVGEVLLFLDDDVQGHPDLLREHLSSHDHEEDEIAVVGALPYPDSMRVNSFLWYLERVGHYDLYKDPRKYPEGRPPMPPMNGNSSIRRSLFEAVGRYDASFRQYGSEDLELGYRLARRGVRFVYNPRAIGYHDHRKGFAQFCRDMEIAGHSLISLYRIYPEIKVPKKIDLLTDGYGELPLKKKLVKWIMATTLRFPFLLAIPRSLLLSLEERYAVRHLLFPLYKLVSHHHYAAGMARGLDETS